MYWNPKGCVCHLTDCKIFEQLLQLVWAQIARFVRFVINMSIPRRGVVRDTEPSSITAETYFELFKATVPFEFIENAKKNGTGLFDAAGLSLRVSFNYWKR